MLMKYGGRTYRHRSLGVTLFATMLLCHGCTPVFEKFVTIHFQGKEYTLHFTALKVHSGTEAVIHLVDVLERLDAGEEVDLSVRIGGQAPLHTAVRHCRNQAYFEVLLHYLLQRGADVNQLTAPCCGEITPLYDLCAYNEVWHPTVEERIRVVALLFSYGAKMDMGAQYSLANTQKKLDHAVPWIVLCKKYRPQQKVFYSDGPLSERYSDLYGITPQEEQAAKQEYWTRITHVLLADKHHHPLDPAFVDYVAQAGVDVGLVQALRRRQCQPLT